MPQRAKTIKDIAKIANVAVSTVSRALQDSPLISVSTKERIQKIARDNNFRLNVRAQNFRLKTTRTIAIILNINPDNGQEISDPFLITLISYIADYISDKNYDLLFSTTRSFSAEHASSYIDEHKADGLIVIGQGKDPKEMQDLAAEKHPMVVWGATIPKQEYINVGSDNLLGGYLATSHLINSGCKSIVFLGDTSYPEVEHRYKGYLKAHKKQKLKVEQQLFNQAAFCIESGYQQISSLISDQQNFDGIVCASDMIALGCINALTEAGIKVPQDVSIVGFDDIPLAAFSTPTLTTVKQDIKQGAALLVEKLFAQIDGQKKVLNSEAKPELIIRNSCAQ